MNDPVFSVGDLIICKRNNAYDLTVGETYKVIEYIPKEPAWNFTFPAYVDVLDDNKEKVRCHASRFRKKE